MGPPVGVARRKYFTLHVYTVSLPIPFPTLTHLLLRTRRNTLSLEVMCTLPTLTTSLRRRTLSLAFSNRPSLLAPAHRFCTLTHDLFFTRMVDVRPLIWAYKFTREIARRMPHFRGEPPMQHPAFAPGGTASVVEHAEGPVSFDAPRIVYSEDDERAIEVFARTNGTWLLPLSDFLSFPLQYLLPSLSFRCGVVATTFHSVSSPLLCAMWASLNVYLCIRDSLARYLCDEAAQTRRRRRREAERVRRAWAESCRPVHRARECQREHLRNCSCYRGESCRDHRGGARYQCAGYLGAIVRNPVVPGIPSPFAK